MSANVDVEQIRDVLEVLFESLNTRNDEQIRQVWHPAATLFLNSTVLCIRPMSFLLSIPDLVRFEIEQVRHIDVQQAIATARVNYRMPVGTHAGFFNLVKVDGQWLIANWVDQGLVAHT
jgi:hypothetical protein